jgi:chromosomal replication initiation ATPase DnaA
MAEAGGNRSGPISFTGRRAAQRAARLRLSDPEIAAVVAAIAADCGFSLEQLVQANRGPAALALARQVAMYLAHTLLGRQMADVGNLFGRDRTTVAHACAVIEDRRERADFDDWVGRLEVEIGRLGTREDDRAAS